jgi:hypothetical protein
MKYSNAALVGVKQSRAKQSKGRNVHARPYGCEHEESDGMKGTFRVSRFQRACDGESDVKGDVGGGGHKEYCENVEGLSHVVVSKH